MFAAVDGRGGHGRELVALTRGWRTSTSLRARGVAGGGALSARPTSEGRMVGLVPLTECGLRTPPESALGKTL